MMKFSHILFSLLFAISSVLGVQAREFVGVKSKKSESNNSASVQTKAVAADCGPPTATSLLDLNNVRAIVSEAGMLWFNRSADIPVYNVPKEGEASALFSGALWLGGVSPDQQLKVAAIRFRQDGNDYWPGPLTNDGTAEISPEVCNEWDKHYLVTRQQAELHNAYYTAVLNGTAEEEFPDGYTTPTTFESWPAIGDQSLNQDFYIAPFFDFNEDGLYDPSDGDYPGYDLAGVIDCKSKFREDPVPLFGDETIWWVFNDKGNIHTESGGEPIGMEIRAQAFAFSTNDEVNNMTFYNYVLINQGTQTLQETYFGQWVDPDLGNSDDDYVGCDVNRGLGYCYNGDAFDEDGPNPGYGENPPAIGVDFFEGPFQDADGIDNKYGIGPNEALNGIGYGLPGQNGDGVIDNERYGMRRFLYHNNSEGPVATQDPDIAVDYYNFLRGIWKDGTPMQWGGNGYSGAGVEVGLESDFMFPGNTDALHWGTDGQAPTAPEWTEEIAGNPAGDRRFIQSAGPFTLSPGDVNNITVGVVWARATGGEPFESVEAVRTADDKAQALFDNCFRILDGPDAPDLTIQELDKELIIQIQPAGNNFVSEPEDYVEFDPFIPPQIIVNDDTITLDSLQRSYVFQGYQVYQLKDVEVSVSDIDNPDLARLVFQCDITDSVGQIINYVENPDIGLPVPTEMVDGADEGIEHSFNITRDLFAQGDDRLINHKTYYYVAISYGYNNYEQYNPQAFTGQAFPYKPSRKGASGSIRTYAAIPHIPSPENGGTVLNSQYGDGVQITRIEGQGNAGVGVKLTQASIDEIMSGSPWKADEITYEADHGPVDIKIIDPLSVQPAEFELWFLDSTDVGGEESLDDAYWMLVNVTDEDTIMSDRTIQVGNDQLIPEYGISINISQFVYSGSGISEFTSPIEAEVSLGSENGVWLGFIPDFEGFQPYNWIRSGTVDDPDNAEWNDKGDLSELYEALPLTTSQGFPLGQGAISPWRLVSDAVHGPSNSNNSSISSSQTGNQARVALNNSVQIVFTPDQSKWTRCPVIEMQDNEDLAEGGAAKNFPREAASVGKNGSPDGSGTGMGWFPGYAINLETGERLNMAFGEDSWLTGENGNDMIWNPSARLNGTLGQGVAPGFTGTYMGGKHYVFVFKNLRDILKTPSDPQTDEMPAYDAGAFMLDALQNGGTSDIRKVWQSTMWVTLPLRLDETTEDQSGGGIQFGNLEFLDFLETEVTLRVAVNKPYDYYPFVPSQVSGLRNEGRPLYKFNTSGVAADVNNLEAAKEALDIINVVPNPYYAYSAYETSKVDNTIKFTNLPEQCTISIYTVNGTLIRQFQKGSTQTSLDWDLKNDQNIPIAGGLYLVHIEVPGVGEKILKWFGVLRPTDLDNF